MSRNMGLSSGDKLGPYEIQAPLGAGGMGEVYRASDPQLRREVAIKVLPASFSRDPDRLRRFEQEARAAAALNHPNILAVYQFGMHEGCPYLVSELLEGSTLREQLLRGPMPVRKAVDYGAQAAHGLAAAHEKGIVHRDLKPENLFLTKDGRIKILDFGLAKLIENPRASDPGAVTLTEGTEPGVVLGTVGYMSPEQVRGQSAEDRSDIFALGAILYEMLTGKRAFHKPTSAETMSAILNEEPPVISQIVPAVPPALQRVVQRCVEKSPAQRFHSASDLAFGLEALSDTGSAPGGAFVAVKSKIGWAWISGLIVVMAIIAVLAVWLARPPAIPVVEAITQLTNDGEPKTGQLLTDGARVYLNEGVSGSLRIAQVSVSGGDTVPLPTQLVSPQIQAITKDGSALLALIGKSVSPRESMWSVALPAGTARRLGEMEVTDASFFPDNHILYTSLSEIYAAESDGSNPRKLAEVSHLNAWFPAVSPNGNRIVFGTFPLTSFAYGPTFEAASDGAGLHEILRGGKGGLPSDICCAKWTPDGKYFIFQARSQGRWDLWVLPEQGNFLRAPATPIRLTNGPLSYSAPIVSRDGKQVFALGSKERGELVRYDAKSAEFVPFLVGVSAFDPTFSRDGKWVAYLSYPDHTLWRSRPDGSDRLQLTYPPSIVLDPRISPDGTRVGYSTPESIAYIVSINGGTPQKVSDNVQSLNWSPDSNLVTVAAIVPGRGYGEKNSSEALIIDLRNGSVSVVPDSVGKVGPWFVEQEKLVAATEDQTKFLLFDLNTGKWSGLAESPDSFPVWEPSLDGKYLYCTTAGADPKAVRIRIADHSIETITSLKNLRFVDDFFEQMQIGVAPDNSPLFTRDVGTQEVYALQVKWP